MNAGGILACLACVCKHNVRLCGDFSCKGAGCLSRLGAAMGRMLYRVMLGVVAVPLLCVAVAQAATPRQLVQTRGLKVRRSAAQTARQQVYGSWWQALQAAIAEIHKGGAGGYSTQDAAHDALAAAFVWNERLQQPVFNAQGARPSFCSGAVYAAVVSGLIRWDAQNGRRLIGKEAWLALLPQRVADGVGPWGCANANGPGFAVLVHRLGAGVSFTDWAKARPADVMKIWWTDKIGRSERGHLVILVRDEGERVRVWSSNMAGDGAPGGFGFKTFAKKDMRRVLFTRITNPAAFNNAPKVGEDAWLCSLLERDVSWEECKRRCGAIDNEQ